MQIFMSCVYVLHLDGYLSSKVLLQTEERGGKDFTTSASFFRAVFCCFSFFLNLYYLYEYNFLFYSYY